MRKARGAEHKAAMLNEKGTPLSIESRPTPTPGPNELLIDVKSIALNPIDWQMRDNGFALTEYPCVIGSDIGGTVVAKGDEVDTSFLNRSGRVAVYAPAFLLQGAPDYGAFQEKVLVPSNLVAAIPDKISFSEASVLGMAVVTAWTGFWTIGLPLEKQPTFCAADKKGMLVWGASSSVGSAAVQIARWMGYTVYATASPAHHDYIKSLGASRVFDYKESDVVDNIIKAAREDGMTIDYAYDAVGSLPQCAEILKTLKGNETAKIASAPQPKNAPKTNGVEVKFVRPSKDEKERDKVFGFIMNSWLTDKLASGEFVPSPHLEVVGRRLEDLDEDLDRLKAGVSGKKLVVEL